MKNLYIKNKVDEISINDAKLEYWSNAKAFYFFNPLPAETKNFFCECGYLPENPLKANNFVNSIAQINDKQDYDIDYALKDVLPKEKYFKLNQQNFLYALYPKVWHNLAVEDRLVCINFAYKHFLNKYNLKNDYRLVWFEDNYVDTITGSFDKDKKQLYINFNSVLKYSGFEILSTVAHEVNHAKQFEQAKNIAKIKDLSKLNTYEQCLNSNNWLIVPGDDNKIQKYLSDEDYKKYLEYSKTIDWKKFVNNFYKFDYLEFSSRNIQFKHVVRGAKKCYEFYNDTITEDSLLNGWFKYINSFTTKSVKEKNLNINFEEYNKFKMLCSYNQERINHLSKVTLMFFKDAFDVIPHNVKSTVNFELERHTALQREIYKTFIQTYENNGVIPQSFDRSNFNLINDFISKQNESVLDTINYYDNLLNKKNSEPSL